MQYTWILQGVRMRICAWAAAARVPAPASRPRLPAQLPRQLEYWHEGFALVCRGKRLGPVIGAAFAPAWLFCRGKHNLPRQIETSAIIGILARITPHSLGLEAGAGTLAAAAHAHMRMRTPCNIHVYCMLELSARCTALCVYTSCKIALRMRVRMALIDYAYSACTHKCP